MSVPMMNVKLWNEIYNTHTLILDTCKEKDDLGVRVHPRTYIAHARALHVHNRSCEIYAYMYRVMTFRLPSQIFPRIFHRTFSTGSLSRMPIKVCGSTVLNLYYYAVMEDGCESGQRVIIIHSFMFDSVAHWVHSDF